MKRSFPAGGEESVCVCQMDTGGGGSGFHGLKLFGATIPMEGTQGNENVKESENDSPEKTLEKALRCPRCKSMETKFCYFNNYNINQPRHFCRGCRRYWTVGGTLRNVPFGAGRRRTRPVAGFSFSGDCMVNLWEVKAMGLEAGVEQWHVSACGLSKMSHKSSSGSVSWLCCLPCNCNLLELDIACC